MENVIFRNYKPYQFRVRNRENELEDYSGGFLTYKDAMEWYDNHGSWLEKTFNRTLVLVENRSQLNLFDNGVYYNTEKESTENLNY